MRNRSTALLGSLILIVLLAACSTNTGAPPTEVIEPAFTATPVPEATEAPTATPVDPAASDLETFTGLVQAATLARDTQAMADLMSDPHAVTLYQSEGFSAAPLNAASDLVTNWFVEGGSYAFDDTVDQTALLDGIDPRSLFDPAITIADTLYAGGLGPEGIAEGLLIIEETAEGDYRWYASLIAFRGFHPEIPPDSPGVLLNQRIDELEAALVVRDFDALLPQMAPNFMMGFWRSEAITLSPEEAIVQLQNNYLPEGSAPIIPIPNPDTTSMLDGQPPQVVFNTGEAFLFSSGWGADAQGEAIIVIDVIDGVYYWSHVLIAPEGFN